jgi:hypothetical protein
MKKHKKLKRRNAEGIVRRVSAPAVKVVRETRAKLSRGGPAITGVQLAAAVGGAAAGSVVAHGLQRVGVGPTTSSLGVAGAGGLGALFLDGTPQALATGAACSGVVLLASQLLAANPRQVAAAPQPRPRQAAATPADVQAAFDAARAQLRRTAPRWEPPPPVYEAYDA